MVLLGSWLSHLANRSFFLLAAHRNLADLCSLYLFALIGCLSAPEDGFIAWPLLGSSLAHLVHCSFSPPCCSSQPVGSVFSHLLARVGSVLQLLIFCIPWLLLGSHMSLLECRFCVGLFGDLLLACMGSSISVRRSGNVVKLGGLFPVHSWLRESMDEHAHSMILILGRPAWTAWPGWDALSGLAHRPGWPGRPG